MATRPPGRRPPTSCANRLGLVRKLVETMRIPVVEAPGFEADDVLATLATQAAAAGDDVIVVTGDRDTYQLVEDPHIKVLYNRRGVSDYVLYDEAGIAARTGVTPRQYPEFAALRGDPSDNLPGVPGVGEKTAAKLINTYGDLANLYAHLDDLTPRLRESLANAQESVLSNARATPLVRDLPLSIDPAEAAVGDWDGAELRRLFEFLEFRTLWDRFQDATGAGKGDVGEATPTPGEELAVSVAASGQRRRTPSSSSRPGPGAGAAMSMAGSWEAHEGRSGLLGLAFAAVPSPAGDDPGDGGG